MIPMFEIQECLNRNGINEQSSKVILQLIVESYRRGLKDGVIRYAIWKDGEQFVGIQQRPLRDVLNEIDNEP